ncbi:MAG TPA: endonuclease V [bacterium]|jgi:deoxyribonuclease V
MRFPELHPWVKTAREAIQLQQILAPLVKIEPPSQKTFLLVAGADVSTTFASPHFWAAVIVLRWPDFEVIEEAYALREADFPYVPGLLSFRELPVMLDAFRKLRSVPDLILCDGQGVAHPRSVGLASHLGLWLSIPTIGCAKTKLVGSYAEPSLKRGGWSDLVHDGRIVGSVLRTRARSKPLFISPGNLMNIESAREWALRCCLKAKLPEPIRLAHLAANRYRLDSMSNQNVT